MEYIRKVITHQNWLSAEAGFNSGTVSHRDAGFSRRLVLGMYFTRILNFFSTGKKGCHIHTDGLLIQIANFVIVSLLLIPVGLFFFGLASRAVSLGIDGDLQKLKSGFAAHTAQPPRRT